MVQVKLRSREQILGDMIRTIAVDTEITAFEAGSDMVTLLEAVSESLSQVEASALKILETINVESLVGTALDKKAQSSRIPDGVGGFGRKPAKTSSGPVIIGSDFEKISTRLYAGKPAPFAGSSTLNVEDASSFPVNGAVYIGRGTLDRFEGPIPYSAIVDNGSFWTISLDQPITKNHLQSDAVTLSQGGDRTVAAGTVVQVPSNSETPAINFSTTRELIIPDGEAEGTVNVAAQVSGESGNVLASAITAFSEAPFVGATVRNSTTFRNGQSIENDEDLRQRIKNYPSTLSRGTDRAILSAIQGATDPNTGRSIQSATILPPVEPGDFARVFIDDGTGLEPNFDNQASELLLRSSSGQETRFRTAQFPISSVQAEGSESAPFALTAGQSITIQIDEIVETYSITASNYKNILAATAYEIVRDFNAQSNTVGFRTIDDGTRIVAIDLSGEAEFMRVFAGDLQEIIGFPTAELRTIFLYRNTDLLSFRGKTAALETLPRNQWNLTAADLTNVRVRVDQVVQTFSIAEADFLPFGSTIASSTIDQWATVLTGKVAGVNFSTSGQILVWSTYNTFSANGQLEILTTREDGSPAGWVGDDKMWLPTESGGILSDVGDTKDFNFNRFTGEITLLEKSNDGDSLEIATRDTRALLRSTETETGLFALAPIPASIGNSKLILGFDGVFVTRTTAVVPGATFTPTIPDATNASNVVRLTMNDVGLFENSEVGDYFYALPDQSASGNIFPAAAEGFYRIIARGFNKTATGNTFLGLNGSAIDQSGAPAFTTIDSDVILVSITSHGLRTGDLITITHAGTIGGISPSVTDAVVTVLDDNNFTYQATATATSTDSNTLDFLGNNKILVTHTAHGLDDGAFVDVTSANSIGGIPNGDVSVTNAPIEFVDFNSYYFRAASAATAAESNVIITSIVQTPDAWVEFEVSAPELAIWNGMLSTAYGLTQEMFYVFKSQGTTPQLIDFGASVSNVNVDDVITTINNQIASGEAVKVSPRQVEIHSNEYLEGGACAVLASIGNAQNLFSSGVSTSIQPHVANSSSSFIKNVAPVVSELSKPTASSAGYPTRTYLKVDKNITNITTEDANPAIESPAVYNPDYPVGFEHIWLTGKGENFAARVYNNETTAPYTGIMTGNDIIRPLSTLDDDQNVADNLDRYANLGLRTQDLPLNNFDSLVVEMDLDATNKTVAVPMAKLAKIQDIDAIAGAGKGQVISFRLLDPEDSDRPFFDSTSVYKDFDFTDFKILTKSVGVYREDASDRALIVRSTDFGASSQLRFSVRLPTNPDQGDFLIVHTNDYLNDKPRLNLIATLPSESEVITASLTSGRYSASSAANGNLYDWRFAAPTLNSNGDYIAGGLLNVTGTSQLSGSYEITNAAYNNFTTVTAYVTDGSNLVTVMQPGHGFEAGDIIAITATALLGGIPAANLSGSSITIQSATVNTFTYNASAAADITLSGTLDTVTEDVATVNNPAITATEGSSIINVNQVGHGLITGELVNTSNAASFAGINPGDLTVPNAVVTVVDSDNFTFNAGAAAAIEFTGTIDSLVEDVTPFTSVTGTIEADQTTIKVTQVGHGLQTGDIIDVTTASGIDTITAGELSVTGAVVTVLNLSEFTYATSPATPGTPGSSGTIDTVTKQVPTSTNAAATIAGGSSTVTVVTTLPHELETGNTITVTTASAIGGISSGDLSVSNAAVTVIDPNTFTYTASASADSTLSGTLDSYIKVPIVLTGETASVAAGSDTIIVSAVGHGLQGSDTITVVTATDIGGISAANLSVTNAAITVIDANNFSYTALANATTTETGTLSAVNGGYVVVSSPGEGVLSTPIVFDAAIAPLRTFPLLDATFEDLADAINAYLPDNPVATAEAIGTDLATNPVTRPTYAVYTNTSPYVGPSMSAAFDWHAFEARYSGSAGIFQYDSSDDSLNNIKATVQTDEEIFPTGAEVSGTAYLPVGEEVQIVPTNTKTLESWLNFSAVSSISILADITRYASDTKLQISSKEDGGDGAVRVTGVTANSIATSVIGNASNVDDAVKVTALSADLRSTIPGQYIQMTNSISAEILRAYRDLPDPANQTAANTETINTYFRPENSVKYVRVNSTTGRLIFLRNGQSQSQTEPLVVGDTIDFTDLGNGLVQVTHSSVGGGVLSARVGDLMYVQPNSPLPIDTKCKPIPTAGRTDGESPEYIGYPVVHVIDSNNLIIIAPNITTFGSPTAITDVTDVVFMPAIWNEKNIRTNHLEGAKFDLLNGNGEAYYLIKSLGNGLVAMFLQNSPNEATDTMRLDEMSVNTDDWAIFGNGFNAANQGTFRIVAHNGRNGMIIYNPNGGQDEIIDLNALNGGGEGGRKWSVGPLNDGIDRALRILSSDSVRIGDRLRISTPAATSQWFNDVFFGSWRVTSIGFQGLDYAGEVLPHTSTSGSADPRLIAPYVDFEIPNAPISITKEPDVYNNSNASSDGSSNITVTVPGGHNLLDGDFVSIVATGALGGLTPSELSVQDAEITYISATQFSYSVSPLTATVDAQTGILNVTENANVDDFLIGNNDISIGFVEGTPFSTIRRVDGHVVNPQNPQNRDLYVTPQLSSNKFSSTFGTQIAALNKIGYEERTFQGIDGYKVYSGLVRQAHRIIDGLPNDTVTFPGTKAAGAIIEVQTPLIRSIQVDLQVRPTDGVTLNSISELVKSAVAGYVNDLGVGSPVVISEIQRTVQSLPGVFSVTVIGTSPTADDDRIVVSDIEKAFILDIEVDVSVG